MDPDGNLITDGSPGEVVVRGPNVMRGYLDQPEATARTIIDGWLHTGDVGRFDVDGYLVLVDRIKDMIIRGGENIYPREIEEFLYTHPTIGEVQVIGVPDAKYGEEVCAWVRLKEGHQATEEDLKQFCLGQIATYKIPRYVKFVTEFPTTVTGKIQKFRMREISVQELGLASADAVKTA
jgi:fatty-acyl-CoA synthase